MANPLRGRNGLWAGKNGLQTALAIHVGPDLNTSSGRTGFYRDTNSFHLVVGGTTLADFIKTASAFVFDIKGASKFANHIRVGDIPGGYTPVNGDIRFAAGDIQGRIGGAWVSLSAPGGSVGGSGAATRVAYWSGATNLTSDANFTRTATTLTVAQPAQTAANSPLVVAPNWNNGAITFAGFTINVTDSASAAGSRAMTVNLGGVRRFGLGKTGDLRNDVRAAPGGVLDSGHAINLIADANFIRARNPAANGVGINVIQQANDNLAIYGTQNDYTKRTHLAFDVLNQNVFLGPGSAHGLGTSALSILGLDNSIELSSTVEATSPTAGGSARLAGGLAVAKRGFFGDFVEASGLQLPAQASNPGNDKTIYQDQVSGLLKYGQREIGRTGMKIPASVRYTSSNGQSISNGSVINFETQDYDDDSLVSNPSTNWTWTAPITGKIGVTACIRAAGFSFSGNDHFGIQVNRNGSDIARLGLLEAWSSNGFDMHPMGSTELSVEAGDTIQFVLVTSAGGSGTLSAFDPNNHCTISYIDDINGVAPSQVVANGTFTQNVGTSQDLTVSIPLASAQLDIARSKLIPTVRVHQLVDGDGAGTIDDDWYIRNVWFSRGDNDTDPALVPQTLNVQIRRETTNANNYDVYLDWSIHHNGELDANVDELMLVRAHRNGSDLVLTGAQWEKMNLTVEDIDRHDEFDTTTQRFQPTAPGWYSITVRASVSPGTDTTPRWVGLASDDADLGGSIVRRAGGFGGSASGFGDVGGTFEVFFDGSNYVVPVIFADQAGDTLEGDQANTDFTVKKLSVSGAGVKKDTTVTLPKPAKYTSDQGQAITGGGGETVDFEDRSYDQDFLVTTGASWVWTAPLNGRIEINAAVLFPGAQNWTLGNAVSMWVKKNGSAIDTLDTRTIETNNTDAQHLQGSTQLQVEAGDTIAIHVNHGEGTDRNLVSDGNSNYVTINYLPTEGVLRINDRNNHQFIGRTDGAGQTITDATSVDILLDTIDRDTPNSYKAGDKAWIVPELGIYAIDATASLDAGGAVTWSDAYLEIKVLDENDSLKTTRRGDRIEQASKEEIGLKASTALLLAKGDKVLLTVFQDSGLDRALEADATRTYMSILRQDVKIPNLEEIQAAEVVGFDLSFVGNASTIFPGNGVIGYDTINHDSHNAVSSDIKTFTAPRKGTYYFGLHVSTEADSVGDLSIQRNGSNYSPPFVVKDSTASGSWSSGSLGHVIPLEAGDTVRVNLSSFAGGTTGLAYVAFHGFLIDATAAEAVTQEATKFARGTIGPQAMSTSFNALQEGSSTDNVDGLVTQEGAGVDLVLTAPDAGFMEINGHILISGESLTAGDRISVQIGKNASFTAAELIEYEVEVTGTKNFSVPFHDLLRVAQNDVIEIFVLCTAASKNLASGVFTAKFTK